MKVRFFFILFYSILFYYIILYSFLFYSFLFFSILFYSIILYYILCYITIINLGEKKLTCFHQDSNLRPHAPGDPWFFYVYLPDLICTVYLYLFSSSYFCGLNILRLFVGKIQFIFCGLNIFRLFVGNIQFIFFGMNVSQSI